MEGYIGKEGEIMVRSGEKPGSGKYKCRTCREIVTLESSTDTMPVCPRCKTKHFDKI